jgi:hypothetical protein
MEGRASWGSRVGSGFDIGGEIARLGPATGGIGIGGVRIKFRDYSKLGLSSSEIGWLAALSTALAHEMRFLTIH